MEERLALTGLPRTLVLICGAPRLRVRLSRVTLHIYQGLRTYSAIEAWHAGVIKSPTSPLVADIQVKMEDKVAIHVPAAILHLESTSSKTEPRRRSWTELACISAPIWTMHLFEYPGCITIREWTKP